MKRCLVLLRILASTEAGMSKSANLTLTKD